MKLSLSSSFQPLFLTLTWPTPVCAQAVTAECFHVHSLRPCPALGEFGPSDLAVSALLLQLPDVSAAAAPPAAPLPHPCGSSGPSGSSLGCSLSITSAPHPAGAWLQAQVSFPAASRRVWVLIYAFPNVCAVKGDTGPLLEHPFHIPS